MLSTFNHPGTILPSLQVQNSGGIRMLQEETRKWQGPNVVEYVDIGPNGVGKGHDQFIYDSMTCYKFVLIWLAVQDMSSAEKANVILQSWSTGCKSFTGSNAPLESAWGGTCLVRSAEILKYAWSGWNRRYEENFNKFLDNIILPNLLGRYQQIVKWNNNWTLSIMEALVQIYIYKKDRKGFDWIISEYKRVAPQTFISNSGKNTEISRDIIHAQFQLMSHIQICEMAWNQGIDLYCSINILNSCEYIASILLGEKPPNVRDIQLRDVYYLPGAWEIAYNHYTKRLNFSLPMTEILLKKKRPEGMSFNWGPGFTHES
jgi:hypothetical protein